MSGYPNPNYGPMPEYPSNVGESCENPKPYRFYDGATFCTDVNITSNLNVSGITTTSGLVVNGIEFVPVLFQGFYRRAEIGADFGPFPPVPPPTV